MFGINQTLKVVANGLGISLALSRKVTWYRAAANAKRNRLAIPGSSPIWIKANRMGTKPQSDRQAQKAGPVPAPSFDELASIVTIIYAMPWNLVCVNVQTANGRTLMLNSSIN